MALCLRTIVVTEVDGSITERFGQYGGRENKAPVKTEPITDIWVMGEIDGDVVSDEEEEMCPVRYGIVRGGGSRAYPVVP